METVCEPQTTATQPGRLKRILFVDDEEIILELYRFMFAPNRDGWEVCCAQSGPEALEVMARQPCEVVVSDMRMPGMNGAQLLTEIMQRYPKTARLILSGYAEQEAVAKCVGAAHQYLMKPIAPEALKSVLARVCALDVFLQNESLKALVSRMSVVPSVPSVYFRMLEELQSPTASTDRIGEIVATDPGLTTKLLQLVNSAFFGVPREISNPTEAVQILGVGTVRSLALTLHAFSVFDSTKLTLLSLDQVWQHSLRAGMLARQVARKARADLTTVDEAFVAGLLHDLGKLMLACNMPEQYQQAINLARQNGVPLSQAEKEIFDATHADVGGYLLGLWGLPVPIVEAVALHHSPSRAVHSHFSPLTAVHVANLLDNEKHDPNPALLGHPLDEAYLQQVGVLDMLDTWRELVAEDE